jgi:uncharacterized protein (TIGR00290 family)
MADPKKLLLFWSSGKDSAWSLHQLLQQPEWKVSGLLTTFNEAFDRVAMHAVRRELVERQAEAAHLPLWSVPLPWPCSNAEYEERMADVCRRAVAEGFAAIAFGDLFLRDIREYRERQLQGTGLDPVFPLWNLPTADLAREMIRAGVCAKLTCVDPRVLPRDFAGRDFEVTLLDEFPAGVDPCGENGEFHTFVYNGPMFRSAVDIELGEIVERDGFVFADLRSPA